MGQIDLRDFDQSIACEKSCHFFGHFITFLYRMEPAATQSKNVDALIVGAGFAGLVMAERLATQLDWKCEVIDRREHIGGNCYDCYDKHGVLVHTYGPHYFRTNSERIKEYLDNFTQWHPVEYKILSHTHGRYWNFPINLNTFEQLIGRPSTSEEMAETLEKWRVPIESPKNSEEVIISQVGRKLYEMFFKNYTRKQWKTDPRKLDASVCGRIPIRTNRDDRYLSEKFQALPKEGYTALFKRMVDHPNITLRLGTDYRDVLNDYSYRRLVYTGMIDEFFGYKFGRLPYRSLKFKPEYHKKKFYHLWHHIQKRYLLCYPLTKTLD